MGFSHLGEVVKVAMVLESSPGFGVLGFGSGSDKRGSFFFFLISFSKQIKKGLYN